VGEFSQGMSPNEYNYKFMNYMYYFSSELAHKVIMGLWLLHKYTYQAVNKFAQLLPILLGKSA